MVIMSSQDMKFYFELTCRKKGYYLPHSMQEIWTKQLDEGDGRSDKTEADIT
jgi:hypothetical protein